MDSLGKIALCLLGLATAALVVFLATVVVQIPLDPEARVGDLLARLALVPIVLGGAGIVIFQFCNPRKVQKISHDAKEV